MKREIPYDLENYELIPLSDLGCKNLSSRELEILHDFIKKYNANFTPSIIIALTAGIFFSFVTIYNVLDGWQDYWGMVVFCAGWFMFAFLGCKSRIPSKKVFKKAQIGELNCAWSLGSNSRNNKECYFDVIFPESHTRYKRVLCLQNEQKHAKRGDKILVVSYNLKQAYGCLLK